MFFYSKGFHDFLLWTSYWGSRIGGTYKLCPQGPDIATPLEVEANLASASPWWPPLIWAKIYQWNRSRHKWHNDIMIPWVSRLSVKTFSWNTSVNQTCWRLSHNDSLSLKTFSWNALWRSNMLEKTHPAWLFWHVHLLIYMSSQFSSTILPFSCPFQGISKRAMLIPGDVYLLLFITSPVFLWLRNTVWPDTSHPQSFYPHWPQTSQKTAAWPGWDHLNLVMSFVFWSNMWEKSMLFCYLFGLNF